MSVVLNDVKIWRSLLQDIPDLYEDSDILKVKLYFIYFDLNKLGSTSDDAVQVGYT